VTSRPPVITLSQLVHPPDLSDWLLYEQHSPSGISGRGLAQGAMFSGTGQLVCTMTLECYFGGKASG
jgi:acyl-CoA thioesterase